MAGKSTAVGARERILATAYDLFAQRGIRDVGIDEVIARAGVAKATLYKYFRTKDDLVLAFLERRERLWTYGFVDEESRRRGGTAEQQLLAIFDVFDEWFASENFDACSFINVLLEMGAAHPAGRASISYLDNMRSLVRARAERAGLRDPVEFARCWHLLMKGSIISAAEGDQHAARRAQAMARTLIDTYRTGATGTAVPVTNGNDEPASGWSTIVSAMGAGESGLKPHDHVVNIYANDGDVVEDVSRFLAGGLAADGAVVVIATAAHRDSFVRRLSELGIDLSVACDDSRCRWLDAADTLSTFMFDGTFSRERFVEVIGAVIADAGKGGRPVRAYGEMVALLWAGGYVAATIELEAMWNDLARSHQFSLYCAYPLETLTGANDLVGVQQVCARHSSVVAPKTYGWADTRIEEHIRRDEEAPSLEFTELYVPVPTAVRAARRFVQDHVQTWAEQAVVHDAATVVSELAANAVTHAGSPFRVSITRADAAVKIAVEDLSSDPPVLDRPGGASAGGGLMLVDALCRRWGVEAGPHGKRVWGEIACPAERQRSS